MSAGEGTFNHQVLRSGAGQSGGTSAFPSTPARPSAPSPVVSTNVRVNAAQVLPGAGLLGRSETTIAAESNGSPNLVAGFNDAQGFCGPPFGVACTPQSPTGLSGYAFSTNGGATWTDGGAPPLFNNVFTRGDPWLASGPAGGNTFYYANLAVDATTGASLGISVHRGHFTGGTFAWEDVRTFDSPANATTPGFDFFDKEAIVASQDGHGDAYVSLTNFQGFDASDGCPFLPQFGFGQIEVFRTHDGGDTWQGPAIAGPEAPDSLAACGFSGTLQQSSAPAIGPNGDVYVVWQFGPTFAANGSFGTGAAIRFARSTDGGATFSSPTTVASINTMRGNPPLGYNRSRNNDHPRIDVAQTGPNRGRIYVTFYSSVAPSVVPPTVQNLTSVQAFITWSDDGGATWTFPVQFAGSIPATGVKRWWPVPTVEPGGAVDVVYYEEQDVNLTPAPGDIECSRTTDAGTRVGTRTPQVDTFWVRSTNGGSTWSTPVKLSSATTTWCSTTLGNVASNIRPNMGDYIGSAGGANRVFAVWADGRNGVADTFFASGMAAGKSG